MPELPLISLVIPNLNCAKFIERTIRSVLDQTYPNLELILSDGGSTDGSLEIIEKYRPHFANIISGPDTGQANAINKGFARATGEIMGWINSDDILLPGSLSLVGSLFALNRETEWLTGRVTIIDEEDQVQCVERPRPLTHNRFLAADYQWIQQESTFWRRSLWTRAGGYLDESLTLAIDGELWLRFSRYAQLMPVHKQIGAFRVRNGQRSQEIEKYHAEMLSVIDRERRIATETHNLTRAVLDAPLKLRRRREAEAAFPGLKSFDPKPFKQSKLWRHALLRQMHHI